MATYNGEKYIKEQLDSILSQLSACDEIIISDDGSNDNTINIIKSFNDSRIRLLHHKSVLGSSFIKATRNFEHALMHAKGDYIFLSDQDDIWKNNKVKVSLRYLQEYICIKSDIEILNGKDKIVKVKKIKNTLLGNIITLPFRGCCMAFRRELLHWILPIPNGVLVHDAWIGCLACMVGKCKSIDESLLFYRIHSNNVSVGNVNNSFCFKLQYRTILLYNIIKRCYLNKFKYEH